MDRGSEGEKLIDWTYGGSWTSEIPLLLFIQPHLSGPSPHGFPPLMGRRVYKPRGHSVLQVEPGASLCVLATLKRSPSYLCKAPGFTSEAVTPPPWGSCVPFM